MTPEFRKWFIGVACLQVLALIGMVGMKETRLRTGETVKLELAPVDPRSLLQGDYMRLNYKISTLPPGTIPEGRYRVKLVLSKDENGIHQFKAIYKEGSWSLDSDDALIAGWVRRDRRLVFGIESFFIPESTGLEVAQRAKYGVVKLSPTGDAMLIGLEPHPQR